MGGRNGERNMGGQRIWYQTMGSQGTCLKGVQMPHTKDRKMEENMVGKDVWKWKDGVKAIVWRTGRNVFFQSMYEPFVIVPLVWIMSMGDRKEEILEDM